MIISPIKRQTNIYLLVSQLPSGYSPFSLFLFIAKFFIRESILCFLSFHSQVISFSCTALSSTPLKKLLSRSLKISALRARIPTVWPVSAQIAPSSWKCVLHFLFSRSSPGSPGLLICTSQVSLLVLPCLLIPDVRVLQGSVLDHFLP